MLRRVSCIALALGVVLTTVGVAGLAQVRQEDGFFLAGNFESREGFFETREGRREGGVFGTIGLRIGGSERTGFRVELRTLNLVNEGFKTEQGETGVIGLALAEGTRELEYDPKSGELRGAFEGILHYELIDRLKGYRPQECKGECDRFEPFVEIVKGEFIGRFREPLQPAPEGKVELELEINYELAEEVLGIIHRYWVIVVVVVDWSLFESSDVLRIQPVFVGSGPSDPNRSGSAFNTLMSYAHDMWNRCASERCIKFVVNDPIYVNNSAYRTLDSQSEAIAFMGTVNVANAVEIFVAKDMSTSLACSWGGGACFSGGTASSKVVSCDQQMSVPCPCPSACTSYCPCGSCLCGAINPYHLAHELGHAFSLPHPTSAWSTSTLTSVMEPSGFCCDNPNLQSAKNCRNASNPLMYSSLSICSGSVDIND